MKRLTFHVSGNPVIPTNSKYCFDAHNIKIIRFCELMYKNNHIVHFYGISECENNIKSTYFHSVLDLSYYKEYEKYFSDPYWLAGNRPDNFVNIHKKIYDDYKCQLIKQVNQYYKNNDIMVHFWDSFNNDYKRNDIIHVKSNFGGWWKSFENVIFETNAWMNYELKRVPDNRLKHKTVIHPWFNKDEYNFNSKKRENTYLYLARMSKNKGIDFFLSISEEFPSYTFWLAGNCTRYDEETKLIFSGDHIYDLKKYPNVTYFGIVNGKEKQKLLSEATALIQPTFYFEPCGWNVIEAMLSGTPVLTPDFGGFIDTVVNGVTGYLCNSEEWFTRVEDVKRLNPYECRNYAIENFNEKLAYDRYYKYFQNLLEIEKDLI